MFSFFSELVVAYLKAIYKAQAICDFYVGAGIFELVFFIKSGKLIDFFLI